MGPGGEQDRMNKLKMENKSKYPATTQQLPQSHFQSMSAYINYNMILI